MEMMRKMRKAGWRAALVACVLTAQVGWVPVQAASPLEMLAQGAVAMAYVSTSLNKMDEEGQAESLARTKAQTGYYENEAAQARVRQILKNLETSPLVKRDYVVYVNPEEEVNAFMTLGAVMSINKGTLEVLDDNQLAYVMAHEIAHGEHKDVISGLKKRIGVSTAIQVYTSQAGTGVKLLGDLTQGYLTNQVFSVGQEKAADELGFEILTTSPYNIGGAAAAMAALRDKYGDHYREGIRQVLAPNDHPKTGDRIKLNIRRMYEYSGKVVNVKDSTVMVMGMTIYKPEAIGQYTSEERAYLMAGKLARLYHDKQATTAQAQGDTVYMGDVAIVGTPSATVATEVATKLNQAHEKWQKK